MTNNYARGVYYERILKKKLEDNNFYVIRSAGSRGVVDLFATPLKGAKLECNVVLQVKTYRGKVPLELIFEKEYNKFKNDLRELEKLDYLIPTLKLFVIVKVTGKESQVTSYFLSNYNQWLIHNINFLIGKWSNK